MANLFWGKWSDYPKEQVNGHLCARIGNRLYYEHAVERFQPSGRQLTIKQDISKGVPGPIVKTSGSALTGGRSVSPNLVEDVILRGQKRPDKKNAARTLHQLGDVVVVTEQNGRVVVTILYSYELG